MIEIKITDPHTMNKDELRTVATMLLHFAGDKLLQVPEMRTVIEPPKSATRKYIDEKAAAAIVPPPPPEPVSPAVVMERETAMPANNPFAKPVSVPPAPLPIVSDTPAIPFPPPSNSAPRQLDPSVELDRRGMPWDNRIHSRTKSKTSDGNWKLMRGITPETVKLIEGELLQAMSVTAPQMSIAAPVLSVPAPIASIAPPIVPIAPVAPQAPFIDPISAPQNDFPALMSKITSAVNSNKITSAQVIKVIQELGFPSLPVIATRPDLIPTVMQNIDNLIAKGNV